jgi:raffinose/stachyose/melibiose transport system permease protein
MTDASADSFDVLGRRPRGLASLLIFATLLVVAGVVLYPVLATALNGFKDLGEIRTNPLGLPRVWVWSN